MTISNDYKPTVSALILNKDNQVLLTHNKNHGPDFWKIPQGGVEPKESLEEAIKREMKEELSSTSFLVLKQSNIDYKYTWPKDVQEKKGFVGPKITFFILRCDDSSTLKPNLEIEELDGIKWAELDSLPSHFSTLPEFQDTIKKLVSEAKQTIGA
ncbi:MAG: NUDIX hydrolase [Patescibacteria group bacterium]